MGEQEAESMSEADKISLKMIIKTAKDLESKNKENAESVLNYKAMYEAEKTRREKAENILWVYVEMCGIDVHNYLKQDQCLLYYDWQNEISAHEKVIKDIT